VEQGRLEKECRGLGLLEAEVPGVPDC
jgi:hypothetical protein